jgi:transcriptional regulator with XRE-family HTH domain
MTLSIFHSLHIANSIASKKVCNQHNDTRRDSFYNANMAKRSRPTIKVTWFLREWMLALGVRQRDMIERAGWSKTTASLLYNCQQDMNVELLKSAAIALNRQTYELLLPPEEAFRIIRHRQEVEKEALRLVSQGKTDYSTITDDLNFNGGNNARRKAG